MKSMILILTVFFAISVGATNLEEIILDNPIKLVNKSLVKMGLDEIARYLYSSDEGFEFKLDEKSVDLKIYKLFKKLDSKKTVMLEVVTIATGKGCDWGGCGSRDYNCSLIYIWKKTEGWKLPEPKNYDICEVISY